MVRQADKISLFKKILKSWNSPSNMFFECLGRFFGILPIDLCLVFQVVIITRLFLRVRFLEAIVLLVNPYY